jgi:predicted Ser/Thr protein kinase
MHSPALDLAPLRDALAGQYDVERELGRGGMGVVFLARDLRLDRLVALKVLPPELAERDETRERFLREARMAAQLAHPHIVPVHRADETGGFAWFAMGYVDGETLGQRLRDRGRLPTVEAVRVLREVAWALAYAHVRGLVHRDVKPDNILIERAGGRAIVTDFGIARADFNAALTADGMVLGTVHYMSPEQCAGEPLDGRSDLYSLGVVGYQALAGRLPFDGDQPHAVLVAHATKAPPALRAVAPDVPAALAAVIDRCLRKQPAERFATGEAMAEALTRALEEAERRSDDAPGGVVSEAAAQAIWRRAAQLQAEAAQRLEALAREPARGDGAGRAATTPTSGYRLRDVEAAAVEAGISQRFVALALAEQQSPAGVAVAAAGMAPWQERAAMRLLGTQRPSLSVSRLIPAPPREVLQAVGRVLRGSPYHLQLRETVGGHPLDGGVLVFDFAGDPQQTMQGPLMWSRWGLYAKELRCTLRDAGNGATELALHADVRTGLKVNLWVYAGLTGGAGVGGGALLAGAAAKLGVAALLGMAASGVGAVATVALGVLASARLHQWEEGKVEEELRKALAAVAGELMHRDLFGEGGTPRPGPAPRAADDTTLLLGA